jgi:16S rRNA C1402 N4-methylase RsmH
MVVISFQSLEDRLVKTAFRKWNRDCIGGPHADVPMRLEPKGQVAYDQAALSFTQRD